MTPPLVKREQIVLEFLADQPDSSFFGLTIMLATDLNSGSMYKAIMALEKRGLIESWFDPDDEFPRRRKYQITENGLKELTS